MRSIDLIRENLKQSEEIVLSRVEDMQKHCMILSTPNGGCHTLWVLGHLAYIESLVINCFMLDKPNPLVDWQEIFDGSEVSTVANHFPSFELALKECRNIRAKTILLLDSLTEEDLNKKSENPPEGVEKLFDTYRRCFQFAADHWYMHRGQLADARRAAGLERMWF